MPRDKRFVTVGINQCVDVPIDEVFDEMSTEQIVAELDARLACPLRQIFERMSVGADVHEDLVRYAWDVFGINILPARVA